MALSSDPPSTVKAAAAEGDASHQSVPLSTAAPAVVEYKESPENPRDFRGDVLTDDTPPDVATLRRTAELVVLDADGKAHSFRSLYEGEGVRPRDRVLVVFVRHFYCGVRWKSPRCLWPL